MNHPVIAQALATELVRDRHDRATADRRARGIRRARPVRESHHIVIREARPADAGALTRLVQLDDAQTSDGRMIVAIVDGKMVAAAGFNGLVIADPFTPTEAIVKLLEMRTRQVKEAEARARRTPRHEWSEPCWPDCPADPSGAVA